MRRMRHLKPREIQGCQLSLDASIATSLYDATSGGSLVAADGAVARWEDQSGNSRHATQATGANQPLRKLAIQGGGDAIRFDGASDYMEHGATSGGDPNTLIVVGVRRAAQISYRVMLTYGAAAGTNGAIFDMRNTSDFVGTYTTTDANSTYTAPSNSGFVVSQRDNSGVSWLANGISQGTAVGNAAAHARAVIGAGYAGSFLYFSQMDFCQAAIYNVAVSDYALRRMHAAAMRKWRING